MLTLLLIVLSWLAAPAAAQSDAAGGRTPTFTRDVSRILQQHCQSCHRPGDIAPFPLVSYADAREHASAIKAATRSRQMPPWMPSECCGTFKGERRLTAGQIAILSAWADAKAPEGDRRDLPPPLVVNGPWALGPPDRVVTMADAFTPNSPTDMYRCFPLRTGLTAPTYLSALDVQPGNRALVHHVAIYTDTSGQSVRLDAASPEPGYPCFGGPGIRNPQMVGGWGPGIRPMSLPRSVGVEIPANATLIMQVHYAGRGHHDGAAPVRGTDRSSIGLYLSATKPSQLLRYVPIVNTDFVIPAGQPAHEVRASMRTVVAGRIWAVAPHMHLLGQRVRMDARLPGGSVRRLIEIERWNFNWQGIYLYDEPVDIPAGTELSVTAVYDNSSANRRNPFSPPRAVSVGEATTDEMCVGVVAISWADGR